MFVFRADLATFRVSEKRHRCVPTVASPRRDVRSIRAVATNVARMLSLRCLFIFRILFLADRTYMQQRTILDIYLLPLRFFFITNFDYSHAEIEIYF